jgi:eukaryotic-like serine/threonine-protein kinase
MPERPIPDASTTASSCSTSGALLVPGQVFAGTDRFEVHSHLGKGGYGVVYEVFDRRFGARVALKTIKHVDPDRLYLFKSEFRALADLYHPNLVQLYELHEHDGVWFFTMELVRGQSALAHVRAPVLGREFGQIDGARPGRRGPAGAGSLAFDEPRLRSVLAQLGEGISFLHEAGRLHRDIKPSNVLVSGEGRLVLLDFGLSLDLASPLDEADDTSAVGTPFYMSPEQAGGRPLGPASDWYSVGVMLYEALTGERPFRGDGREVMERKQLADPPPPSSLAPATPPDLDALAVELLRRQPAARPSGAELLARLGASPAGGRPSSPTAAGASPSAFVGRTSERAALRRALDDSRSGPVTVLLQGESGIGKTALLRQFLDDARGLRPPPLLLAGRCHEQESVPFNALDTAIDALARHLRRLPDAEVEALLPEGTTSLASLFPVLRQVTPIERRARGEAAADGADGSPLDRRRRASAALRRLLSALGAEAPVVLAIDSLQWGDQDSAALLVDLLRPVEGPPLMFVAAFRSEEAPRSACLRALLPALVSASEGSPGRLHAIELGELAQDDSERLARTLAPEIEPEQQRAVAVESGGHPLFLGELASLLLVGNSLPLRPGDPAEALLLASRREAAPSLGAVMRARIARLPPPAQRLLEVVAVAGQPVEREVAQRAAGLGADAVAQLGALQAARLLRARGQGRRAALEIYHDRVRLAVLAGLDDARQRALHLGLAEALEHTGRADPETLSEHLEHAGERARAALQAAAAGDRAAGSNAFDRAARLYLHAADLHGPHDDWARAMWVLRGEALSNAGRGPEAARSFLRAADGAPDPEALDLERRAAEQLLVSGRLDEGLAVARRALAVAGLRLPEQPGELSARLLWLRARIAFRGTGFRERGEDELDVAALLRVDTCWAVALGLSAIDPARGALFSFTHQLLALEAGEPLRIVRALGAAMAHEAARGGPVGRPEQAARDGAAALAARLREPLAGATLDLFTGVACYLRRDVPGALASLDASDAVLRMFPNRTSSERKHVRLLLVDLRYGCGEWREALRELPSMLADARERGDLLTETSLRTLLGHVPHLLARRPRDARDEVSGAIGAWSDRGFHAQHLNAMLSLVDVELYDSRGRGEAAWAHVERAWPALERSMLLDVQLIRCRARAARGRAALAAAGALPGASRARARLLGEARREARSLSREERPWAAPFAALIDASVLQMSGDRPGAIALLAAAADGLASCKSAHYAAAAHHRLAALLPPGSPRQRAASTASAAWFAAEQIDNGDEISRMLAPGAW